MASMGDVGIVADCDAGTEAATLRGVELGFEFVFVFAGWVPEAASV